MNQQSTQTQASVDAPAPDNKQVPLGNASDAQSQGIDASEQLAVYARASKSVATNDLGLPLSLLRMDLIPPDFNPITYSKAEYNRILDNASLDINYDEGFPALNDAAPVWGQIDGYEPPDAYELFRRYLDLGDTYGVRQLAALSLGESIATATMERIRAYRYFITYSWAQRAKAFDLYQYAADKKLREKRILNSTNIHYLNAEKIMTPLMEQITKIDDNGDLVAFANLDGDKLVATLDRLVSIQRKSIGLDVNIKHVDTLPKGAQVETLMRQVSDESQDPHAQAKDSRAQIEQVLLAGNTDAARLAQNLATEINRDHEAEAKVQAVTVVPTDLAKEIAG